MLLPQSQQRFALLLLLLLLLLFLLLLLLLFFLFLLLLLLLLFWPDANASLISVCFFSGLTFPSFVSTCGCFFCFLLLSFFCCVNSSLPPSTFLTACRLFLGQSPFCLGWRFLF